MTPEQETYRIRRLCGRSNRRVIVEYVRYADPGTVFRYEELSGALSAGCDRVYTKEQVQDIVRRSNPWLLEEYRRVLRPVENVGYQVAYAREHVELANARTRKGHRQIAAALMTLENTRVDELTGDERQLHMAQCVVNRVLFDEQRKILSRQARHDRLIARLTARVDQLEGRKV